MKKLLVVLLLMLSLGISAIVYMNLGWQKSTAPAVIQLETALSDQQTFAFGYVDFQQTGSALTEVPAIASWFNNQSNWLQLLWAEQNAGRLEQTMFALSQDKSVDKQQAEPYLVFHGRFAPQSLIAQVSELAEINKLSDNLYQIKDRKQGIELPDAPYACPKDIEEIIERRAAVEYFVALSDNWIVQAANAEKAQGLLNKLMATSATPSTSRLSPSWQQYSDGKFAAMAVFNPEQAADSLSGMMRFFASDVQHGNADVSAIFAGMNISGSKLKLSTQLQANQSWVTQSEIAITQGLQTLAQRSELFSPELAGLLKSIELSSIHESLQLQMLVQADTFEFIPRAIEDGISKLFLPSMLVDDDTREESINDSPLDYSLNQLFKEEHAFIVDDSNAPRWVQDSFAFDLTKVSFNDAEQVLELNLHAWMQLNPESDHRPSHKTGAQMQLGNIKVLDNAGNDLVRDERCNSDIAFKNQEPIPGASFYGPKADLFKSIRLKAGKGLADIDRVQAKFSFTAPVDVAEVTIELQDNSQTSFNGVDFKLVKVRPQGIDYLLEGEERNLLEIRAFNKKGQVLDRAGSMSFGAVSKANFEGDIANVTLYIAQNWVERQGRVDMPMAEFLMPRPKPSYARALPQGPAAISIEQFNQFPTDLTGLIASDEIKGMYGYENLVAYDEQSTPIALYLEHEVEKLWANEPRLHYAVPFIEPLALNLQALRLTFADQFTYLPIPFAISTDTKTNESRLSSGFKKHNGIGFSLARVELNIPLEADQKLENIAATLEVNLPQSINEHTVSELKFIDTLEVDGVSLRLQEIETDSFANTVVAVSGDKFVNLTAMTDEGELEPQNEQYVDGKWLLSYSHTPKVNYFKLYTAGAIDTLSYDFELKPEYK